MGGSIQKAVKFCDEKLDVISRHWWSEKPTTCLAINNMDIPIKDRSVLNNIYEIISATLQLPILPGRALVDKKFCTQSFESSSVFRNGNQAPLLEEIPNVDKLLIYLSKHEPQIVETRADWHAQTLTIDKVDYDVPTNLWMTFKLDDDQTVFFYVHISVTQGYHGVLLAVDKLYSSRLKTLKDRALNYYRQSLGRDANDFVGFGNVGNGF